MKRNIGAILFSVILISVITFPFLWLLLGSFKTMKELFSVPIRFFPEHISLDNYIAVFKAQPFGLYLYGTEPELIFLDDPVDTTVIRRFGNDTGIMFQQLLQHLDKKYL